MISYARQLTQLQAAKGFISLRCMGATSTNKKNLKSKLKLRKTNNFDKFDSNEYGQRVIIPIKYIYIYMFTSYIRNVYIMYM